MRKPITLAIISSIIWSHPVFMRGTSTWKARATPLLFFAFRTLNPSSQPLPRPTGSYSVGTSILHLVDTTRPDVFSKRPGQFRELMVQVYYPSDSSPKGHPARYIPDPSLLRAMKEAQYYGLDSRTIEGWKDVQTHAVLNSPISRKHSKFPLLLFSPGWGVSRSHYTALCHELASRGYIAVVIDHPYGGVMVLPDGRIISSNADTRGDDVEMNSKRVEEWARDASFVLDSLVSPDKAKSAKRFAKHINVKMVGMLGHSLGGAAALETCRTDSRFKACADLDGAPFGKVREEGVRRPTLILRSSPVYTDEDLAKKGRTREQWEKMGQQVRAAFESLLSKRKDVPGYSIAISGTGHMSFSDAPFVMPETITQFGGRIIDSKRGFEIITRYIRGFFDKYLRDQRKDLLDRSRSPYPEVSVKRFNP